MYFLLDFENLLILKNNKPHISSHLFFVWKKKLSWESRADAWFRCSHGAVFPFFPSLLCWVPTRPVRVPGKISEMSRRRGSGCSLRNLDFYEKRLHQEPTLRAAWSWTWSVAEKSPRLKPILNEEKSVSPRERLPAHCQKLILLFFFLAFPKGTCAHVPKWLCIREKGKNQTFQEFLDNGSEPALLARDKKHHCCPQAVGTHEGQTTNEVLPPVHFTVGTVDPWAHPVVTFPIPDRISISFPWLMEWRLLWHKRPIRGHQKFLCENN